jgi:steroid 5-alpha reductase family enzyme
MRIILILKETILGAAVALPFVFATPLWWAVGKIMGGETRVAVVWGLMFAAFFGSAGAICGMRDAMKRSKF